MRDPGVWLTMKSRVVLHPGDGRTPFLPTTQKRVAL